MAEALFAGLVAERADGNEAGGNEAGGNEPSISVFSAGTAAREGDPATPEAIQALGERGVDLRGHRARQVTAAMIAAADLVLTMTAAHKQALLKISPETAGKVFTIKEFARGRREAAPVQVVTPNPGDPGDSGEAGDTRDARDSLDLPDPYGLGLAVYRATADELERELRRVVERLLTGN